MTALSAPRWQHAGHQPKERKGRTKAGRKPRMEKLELERKAKKKERERDRRTAEEKQIKLQELICVAVGPKS